MRIAIIGAGIAGLSAAVRLRHAGHEVEVYDQNEYPGGKLREFHMGGYRFDAGPSLFTMPHFVDELFELCGEKPSEHFSYTKLENICQYFWEDGTKLASYSDLDKYGKEVEEKLGVPAQKLRKALLDSQKKYDLTGTIFLFEPLNRIKTWLRKPVAKALFQLPSLDIFSTMDSVNRKNLGHPKLVQIFNRYATYNGSSPYKAPGILTIIPHIEHGFGAFIPKGGMYDITKAIFELGQRLGVQYYLGMGVEKILVERAKAVGIVVNGERMSFDAVVSNADAWATYTKLIPDQTAPEKILAQERSSSALIFYWGINRIFAGLDLHNIFFSEDYKKEFEHLFEKKEPFADPTIYVNITSKHVPSDAPDGHENWFVMVNVPANKGQDWKHIKAESRKQIIEKLSRVLGVDIEQHITCEQVLDPVEIEVRTASHQGSLYGSSSNGRYAAFLRHQNQSSRIANLYFCGGSVHPGGGVPLCLLSGKIVGGLLK